MVGGGGGHCSRLYSMPILFILFKKTRIEKYAPRMPILYLQFAKTKCIFGCIFCKWYVMLLLLYWLYKEFAVFMQDLRNIVCRVGFVYIYVKSKIPKPLLTDSTSTNR